MPQWLLTPAIRSFAVAAKAFLWVTASAIFIGDNYYETSSIKGASMAPTLSPSFDETGDRDVVLWNKASSIRQLERGDVVKLMLPHRPDDHAVKRVVALPGDTVILDPRRRPMESKDDVIGGRLWDSWEGRVMVPFGHVWVEGDNKWKTKDSNDYGPVSKSLIDGKASRILWPLSRLGEKPWEGWKGKTKVIEGRPVVPEEFADVIDPRIVG